MLLKGQQDSVPSFNSDFYRHLISHKLYAEATHYLKKNPALPDSLLIDQTLLCLKLNKKDSTCYRFLFPVGVNPILSPAQQARYLGLLFSKGHENKRLLYLAELPSFSAQKNEVKLALCMVDKKKPDTLPDSLMRSSISPGFQYIVDKYTAFKPRSPMLAGSLSLVPGLGKFYSGYHYQGASALILNSLLFLQMAESYHKAGAKSFRFGFTAALFSVFYVGNIYGSYTAARKRNTDFYEQISYEISNYYLYPPRF